MEFHKLSSPITDLSSRLSCLPTLLRHMPSLTRPPALITQNQMDWLRELLGLPNVCLLKQGKVKVIFHLVCWNTGTHQFVVQLRQPNFLWVEICAQFYHQTTKHLAQKAPNNQEIRNKILNQTNQATFYNQQAKALPPLTIGDHVHVQKEGKWDPAVITQKHERSYTLKSNDSEYRRNRVHLNKSLEQPDKEYHSTPVAHQNQETSDTSPSSKVNGQIKTRSGPISKPPDRWSLGSQMDSRGQNYSFCDQRNMGSLPQFQCS